MTGGTDKPGAAGDVAPGLGDRVRTLSAIAGEHLHGDVEERFGVIICDGCGATVRVDVDAALDGKDHLLRVTGWRRHAERDYCNACVQRGMGEGDGA